jgi:hypothetical protein
VAPGTNGAVKADMNKGGTTDRKEVLPFAYRAALLKQRLQELKEAKNTNLCLGSLHLTLIILFCPNDLGYNKRKETERHRWKLLMILIFSMPPRNDMYFEEF